MHARLAGLCSSAKAAGTRAQDKYVAAAACCRSMPLTQIKDGPHRTWETWSQLSQTGDNHEAHRWGPAARFQAHQAQSGAVEGISLRLIAARLRVRCAARSQGPHRCAALAAAPRPLSRAPLL